MEMSLDECWKFYNALNEWNRIDYYSRLRSRHPLTPEESVNRFMAQFSFLSLMPREFQDALHQENLESLHEYCKNILKFELKRATEEQRGKMLNNSTIRDLYNQLFD